MSVDRRRVGRARSITAQSGSGSRCERSGGLIWGFNRVVKSFSRLLLILLAVRYGCSREAEAKEGLRSQGSVRIIYDTDMGNDIDDALALGVIHALQSREECTLLAVTVSKGNFYAAAFSDLVNHFYGRPQIPVGLVRDGMTPEPGSYVKQLVEARDGNVWRYPRKILRPEQVMDATDLLRRTLSAQPDAAVTVVVVGFATNLARLLDSAPDRHSPLDGRQLVARKVGLLSMMGGHFGIPRPEGFREYNIRTDLDASRRLLSRWPTPIVMSGYEIGESIQYPAESIQKDFGYQASHPLEEGYELYGKMPYDRSAWDLTSVLYAVRPDRGYFQLSEPGEFRIGDQGTVELRSGGQRGDRHLTVTAEQIIRVREALVALASQPPAGQ